MENSCSLEELSKTSERMGANKMLLRLLEDKVISGEVAKHYMIPFKGKKTCKK